MGTDLIKLKLRLIFILHPLSLLKTHWLKMANFS